MKTKKIVYGIAGICLGGLFLFPIYILVLNSFKNTKGIFTDVTGFPNADTFTLDNYPNAFKALEYIRSFFNSLGITVISTILILLISAMAAWVLVRYKTKISKVIFLFCCIHVDPVSVCYASPCWICQQDSFNESCRTDLYVYGIWYQYGNCDVSWIY